MALPNRAGPLKLERRIDPLCTFCPGWRSAKTVCVAGRDKDPELPFPRKINVLFVGEMPGPEENEEGTAFVGKSGKLLDIFINAFLKEDEEWYITNAFRCFLGRKPNRELRKPDVEMLRTCAQKLGREIRVLKPDVIVPLGTIAAAAIFDVPPSKIKPTEMRMTPVMTKWGVPAFMLHHPAWVVRNLDAYGDGPNLRTWETEWAALRDLLDGKEHTLPGKWAFLETREEIEQLYEDLYKTVCPIAYDYETTGLDPWEDEFRMVGYAFNEATAFVHPLKEPWQLDLHKRWLTDSGSTKIIHSFGMELRWALAKFGIEPSAFLDTKVLAFLGNENRSMRLESLVSELAPQYRGFKVVKDLAASDIQWAERCAGDVMATYYLHDKLLGELTQAQIDLWPEIEGFLRSLIRCWYRGWKTDRSILEGAVAKAEERFEQLYQEAVALPDVARFERDYIREQWELKRVKVERFNLGSGKMVPTFLEVAGISPEKPGHIQPANPGRLRTAREVLEYYEDRHPLISLVIEYKKLQHILSQFLRPLLRFSERDGFLHPGYNWGGQASIEEGKGTVTCRPSCSRPNLMNLPRPDKPQDPLYNEIRRSIVSRFEGGQILQADYSQLELRILGMRAPTGRFAREYRKEWEGEEVDIHDATAKRLGLSRADGKTVNFAVNYFAEEVTIAKNAGVSQEKAAHIRGTFWLHHDPERVFFTRQRLHAIEHGWIEGSFGIRLHCPDIQSGTPASKAHAARRVGNWDIQHTGGMLCCLAMPQVEEEIERRGFRSLLIGNLYDALYLDVHPEDDIEELKAMLVEVMQKRPEARYDWITVPLKVDLKVSSSMAG